MPVTEFEDTQPTFPAPLYGHTTGQHNHLPSPKLRRRRWALLILAIVLVAVCAAPVLFFTR